MKVLNFKTAIAATILSGAMVIFSSCENNDEEIAKLENQIKQLRSQSNENFPFLEEKLTKLQSELTKSKNQLTSVNNKLLDIDELEFLLNSLSSAIDSLKNKPNPTMTEIEGLEAELQKIKDVFFTEFQTTGKHAGHDWVDLGTTVLWATCNIGANKPEECGQYFAWGETKGYAKGEAHEFNWANCFDITDGKTFITYHNGEGGLKELTADHDAATQNWGGKWRMPSKDELKELNDEEKIHSEWVTNYKSSNVKGRVFYKKKEGEANYDVNSDVHIFLPAAGNRDNVGLYDEGYGGFYWSRSLYEGGSYYAWYLYFYSYGVYTDGGGRSNGSSVRPVCPCAD